MQITHLSGRRLVAVIASIGVRHDGAHTFVTDGLYLDLRHALRNPADDPTMRYRTGLDCWATLKMPTTGAPRMPMRANEKAPLV